MIVFTTSPSLPPPTLSDRPRARVARNWFIACLACGVLFVASFPLELSYTAKLSAWFGAFFSGFHAHFAIRKYLRIATVRRLDYWYLGLTAIGVILFAAAYADSRAEYLAHLDVELARYRSAQAQRDLRDRTDAYVRQTCNFAEQRDLANCDELSRWRAACGYHERRIWFHCGKAKELAAWARSEHSIAELQAKMTELQEFSDRDRTEHPWTEQNWQPTQSGWAYMWTWIGSTEVIRPMKRQIERIEEIESANRLTTMPAKEWRPEDIYFGIGQTVLWPFILAVAFALRLTKVTIEAYQWSEG